MDIYRIKLSKDDLLCLPDNERVFLVYAGHALNELNVLCRLIVFAMPIRRSEPERQFMVIQSMMLIRMLAGKLHETWNLFNLTFYKSKLAASMKGSIGEKTETALGELKKYFNSSNASISKVRHKHAFHYDVSQVNLGLSKLPPRAALDIYFDENTANTIWGFADSIINSAVTTAIDSENHKAAFETLMAETQSIAKLFQTVLEGILEKIICTRMSTTFQPAKVQQESVRSTAWKQCELPTFVDDPAEWSATLAGGKIIGWSGQKLESSEFLRSLLKSK